VISLGYNGSLPKVSDEDALLGDLTTVHAEENAILLASESLQNSTMYVTHAPCNGCGRMVFEAGITNVKYLTQLGCPHFFDNVTREFKYSQKESYLLTELLKTIRQYFKAQHISPGDTVIPQTAINRIATALNTGSNADISIASYLLLKEPKVATTHPNMLLASGALIEKLATALQELGLSDFPFQRLTKSITLERWNGTQLFRGEFQKKVLIFKTTQNVADLRSFVAMRYV
jgi:hypothetical protein